MARLRFRPSGVLAFALCLGLLGPAGAATAGTITPTGSPLALYMVAVEATAFPLFIDVRGPQTFDVSDPGPVGSVFATEQLDLVTSPPFPAPVAALRVVNGGFTESVIVTFNPGGFRIDGTLLTIPADYDLDDSTMTVPADGTPLGSVSDPALVPFLGPLLFSFDFDFRLFDDVGPFSELTLMAWHLTDVRQLPPEEVSDPPGDLPGSVADPVAGPGGLALVAIGGVGLGWARWRHRTKRSEG